MNEGLSVEIVGAGIALLIIFAITFFFLSLKRRRARRAGQSGDTNAPKSGSVNRELPTPTYAALAFLLQPEPLGNIPGTGLPAETIALAGRSIAHHISLLGCESSIEGAQVEGALEESARGNNAPTENAKVNHFLLHKSLWSAIEAKFAENLSGLASQEKVLDAMELTQSSEGYAARISYENKKYTILIGSAAPVALASAPFSSEIATLVTENRHNDSTLVLVIDGIAYAAISLNELALNLF